jgi:hypothetical protein
MFNNRDNYLGFLDKSMLGIQWVVFDKPVFGLDILEFLVGLKNIYLKI